MLWYHALVLGFVQGLTEFLPISSSGHLVAIPIVLGWQSQPLVFDLMLHLGTATALIAYFRDDIKAILVSITREISREKFKISEASPESKLGIFILIGCIPAGVLGVLFEDYIEATFRGLLTVSLLLIGGSLIMYLAEIVMRRRITSNSFNELSGASAGVIGMFQALAIFPGISRSGATISGGMLLGLTRDHAARFSFLLSIPIVLAASLFSLIKASGAELASIGAISALVGFLSSFIVGFFAIDFLMKFLKSHSLHVFILYRILLAMFLLASYFNVLS